VGDYEDVQGLAHELGVADRVTFFGSVSESVLRVLYQTCDVFCLPSRKYVVNEGLPVSLMEAMACAKPVISTRHAGIPELVPEILVEENDVAGLARALAYLADHPQVRHEMGLRNRKIVEREYSAANVAQMEELLTSEPRANSRQEGKDYEDVGHRRSGVRWVVPSP
jgi:colanic acid/amylovoran biosynthesis glycosyltransferase